MAINRNKQTYCGNKWIKIRDEIFQDACKIHDSDYNYIKSIFIKNPLNKSVLAYMKKEADIRFLNNMLYKIENLHLGIIKSKLKSIKAYMMYYAVRMLTDKYVINN